MKTFLLSCLLFLTSFCAVSTVAADDSGLFYDPDRQGEGIVVTKFNDLVAFYFFTYGGLYCGEDTDVYPSPLPEWYVEGCDYNGQRWFLGVNEMDGDTVTGDLYMTHGLFYPHGIVHNVGQETVVGHYLLIRMGSGWVLDVDRVGDALPSWDWIFNSNYDFSNHLLPVKE